MDNSNEMLKKIRADIEKSKQQKRRWLIITGLILLLVTIVSVGATITLLKTNTSAKINDLRLGQTQISVVENEDYDWEKKEVRLVAQTGDGYVPGVAQVMFIPYMVDDEGNYIICELDKLAKPVGNKLQVKDIVLELATDWEDYWFFQNGYFYYRTVLYPEAGKNTTPVLLKKVSFAGTPSDIDDLKVKYSAAQINVEVLASILQAEGSAPASGSVLESEWGVKVTGSTVSPELP